MKVSNSLLLIISLSTLLLPRPASAVTLLFTSNIPDIFQDDKERGITNLAGYIETLKKESDESVLFIHGGDSLFPNALSVYDKGAHMIDILNVMETDAFMVNQREFAKGLDALSLRTEEASFPMILSNVRDMRTMDQIEGTYSYFLTEKDGLSIGVIMIMSTTVNVRYLQGQAFVRPPLYEMKELANRLRQKGADKVISVVGSDLAIEYDISEMAFVDLVLVSVEGKDEVDFSGFPLLAKGGGNDGELIKIQLNSDNKLSTAEVIDYSGFEESIKVSKVVDNYINRLSIVLNQEVGTLLTPVNSLRLSVRSEENALGNLFADALRSIRDTDFAVINGGSIRGYKHYSAGTVFTRKDIQNELPFGGKVRVFDISPAELKQAMEHSLSAVGELSGRFLHISGFEVIYDLNRPIGDRVLSITKAGEPLTKESYTLATRDFLHEGGDNYNVFLGKKTKHYPLEDPFVWSAVIYYIEASGSVSPKIDGRLTRVDLEGIN
mgnify:CR=1 FL=1